MLAPHLSALARLFASVRSLSCRIFFVLAAQLVFVAIVSRASATNGTWIDTTSGGLWSAAGNWSGGIVANGTDGIADFSTLNITSDNTVHLDTARTIGQLKFGDTTPSNNWILDNNGNAADVLLMEVSSGSPQITVNNDQATINLSLQGTNVAGNFVVVNGPGTLVLGGTTDNSGLGIMVNSGTVILAKTSSGSPNDVHAIGQPGLVINGGLAQLGGTGGDQIYDLGSVAVSSGTFDTAGQSETFNVLSLAGTGIGGNGALLNSSLLFSTITPTGGTVLTANATIGVTNLSMLTLNSTISGAFGLTKVGPGTLALGGGTANTFTGTTTVNAGILFLDKPFGAQAIGGNLIIGTGTGLPGSAVVLDGNNFELGAFAPPNVTIQSDGALNLQTFGEFIDNLTMTGGSVTNGVLALNGTSITTKASNYTATISSRLQIQSAQFTIAQGTTASGIDLDVSGTIIENLTIGSITKSGLGALRLSGNSTFSGGVTLSAGTLIIGNNNALGTGTLTVSGGALAADSNGPYVVSNPVSHPTTLIVSGGGNFTLAGPISGTGGLTMTGTGVLTLSGAESFTGPININSGSLAMSTSLSNNITNAGTFVYNSGTFGGRLTNLGTVVLNAAFTAANGMENDGAFTLATGQTVTLNGAGLDNEGTFTMTGGTLNLNPAGNNVNNGTLNLSANLGLGTTTLTNSGTLALAGGLISGASGSLINTVGGMISGTGAITCLFNNAGLLAATGGNLKISQAFSNSGLIELDSITANLAGGAIANSGTIQGFGNIGNPISNTATGTIEALGGTLALGGAISNPIGGLIRIGANNKILVTDGLSANAGTINLIGGTFDNNGQPLNNTGQISGFGIFATGGTGLDNNGSITFSGGLTTVNGPVTNEGGKTITVAQNNAIFTGLVTNNASATFNAVNATATFAGGFVNNGNSNFVKAGGGIVEVDAAPTLNNGSTLSVTTGTLRFALTGGAPTIGTGVTAVVSSGATLELAGSVSALANGSNRVNVLNNSNAPGLLVSGANQQVGNIDGSGTTQVNAGSDLTANHIIQSALVIGGTSKNPGLVTIDASDASGNPLASAAVFSTPTSLVPLGADPAGYAPNGDPLAESSQPLVASVAAAPIAVPEPSSLFMLAIGGLAVARATLRRSAILNWKNRAPRA